MLRSPFQQLAFSPEIDIASEFVERRVQRMRDRSGPEVNADYGKQLIENGLAEEVGGKALAKPKRK